MIIGQFMCTFREMDAKLFSICNALADHLNCGKIMVFLGKSSRRSPTSLPQIWRCFAINGGKSMEITERALAAANRRGAEKKATFPIAVAVRYERRIARIVITLASGLELAFLPSRAQGLEHARPADLIGAEISPSGLGIHFPKLDVDIYIPALLEGFFGSRRWMAAEIGKLGGRSSSPAKAAAARRNGKLGGRPKKVKECAPG